MRTLLGQRPLGLSAFRTETADDRLQNRNSRFGARANEPNAWVVHRQFATELVRCHELVVYVLHHLSLIREGTLVAGSYHLLGSRR